MMTTDISSDTASTAGASVDSANSSVDNSTQATDISASTGANANTTSGNQINSDNLLDINRTGDTDANAVDQANTTDQTQANATTAVITADGKTAYVPNYKYKAALQEKELDPFFHSLIKDQDSEKKVKDLFTKVDAFDFVKGKKEQIESEFRSLSGNYDDINNTVTKFNDSVQKNDLSSAFRTAGITKEQVFKWTQAQLELEQMPPEQRQQYEQHEQAKQYNSELEERTTHLQRQYEQQAVQVRTMQLENALQRPEVSRFAEAWDRNSEQPGAFREFVAQEARKVYYESSAGGTKPGTDLSPEQAIGLVMQKFGKFFNTGDTVTQSPQAIPNGMNQNQKPVIPNITGKASSPIKKVPRSIEDLKALAKSMR